jgi:hypothetical protein
MRRAFRRLELRVFEAFVVGGLAATGAGALFYLDQRRPVTILAPTPLGMSCVGRF